MSPLLSGMLAAWIAFRLTGVRGRLPWQALELGAHNSDPPGADVEPLPSPHTPRLRRPRRSRPTQQFRRAVETDLPITVDLLHVAVTAGHSLHTAVAAVGGIGTGPVSGALAEADRRFRHGSRLVDELDALAVGLGPSVRPLSTTLVVAASSGAPLGPTLQRLADAERRRLRRRTEERVRRLPVVLLAPLVGLVLPAFVILTIVPVALSTARTGLLPSTPARVADVQVTAPPLPSTSIHRSPP